MPLKLWIAGAIIFGFGPLSFGSDRLSHCQPLRPRR